MKTIFLWASLGTLLLGTPLLHAQDSVTSAEQRENRMLAFLSGEDRNKYLDAKAKTLADNPDLKTEQDELIRKHPAPNASKDDRQAFMEKWKDYSQKLREAMLKADPTVQPIFDEIDKHMADLREQRQKSANGGTPPASGSN
jgi:hypothetical protein